MKESVSPSASALDTQPNINEKTDKEKESEKEADKLWQMKMIKRASTIIINEEEHPLWT